MRNKATNFYSFCAASLAIIVGFIASHSLGEERHCPGGGVRSSLGLCPAQPKSDEYFPPNVPVQPILLSGFESASLIVPDEVVDEFIQKIISQREGLDGMVFGDQKFFFDLFEVIGLYDRSPLTSQGKVRVFREAERLGLLKFTASETGKRISRPSEITDETLGRLRVHSLNKTLRSRRLPVQIVFPPDLSKVQTIRGPRADDPTSRGVRGNLRPTAIPNSTG